MTERERELYKALVDTTTSLMAATSAYETYVGHVNKRGICDPVYNTRIEDFRKAIKRAHNACKKQLCA